VADNERDEQAKQARERAIDAHRRAKLTHERAAVLHEQVVEFQEKHAALERELGRDKRAEEMEERADRARGRSEAERLRAVHAQEEIDHAEAGRNSFLDSVLTSLHSGVVVLDRELRVQAWNAAAEDLWGLRADEVEGQHFLNLDIGLPVNELSKPLRESLSNGGRTQLEVQATTRRGRAVRTQVRISAMDGSGVGNGVIVLMEARDGSG
jgi:two-component system CheB/CheR fusion protein